MMNISIYIKVKRLKDKIKSCLFIYYNRFLFSVNGISFGNNLKVYNDIYLIKHPKSRIVIGNNLKFTSGNGINPLCRNIKGCIYLSDASSRLVIGDNVGISSSCIRVKNSIKIGNRVLIGGDSILLDTDAHNLDYRVRALRCERNDSEEVLKKTEEFHVASNLLKVNTLDSLTAKSAPIIIEDDVLIGARCIILKGVTIGARSIIGAGSVVTCNIPPDEIWAGNPAKFIKKLIH